VKKLIFIAFSVFIIVGCAKKEAEAQCLSCVKSHSMQMPMTTIRTEMIPETYTVTETYMVPQTRQVQKTRLVPHTIEETVMVDVAVQTVAVQTVAAPRRAFNWGCALQAAQDGIASYQRCVANASLMGDSSRSGLFGRWRAVRAFRKGIRAS